MRAYMQLHEWSSGGGIGCIRSLQGLCVRCVTPCKRQFSLEYDALFTSLEEGARMLHFIVFFLCVKGWRNSLTSCDGPGAIR